ncbi:MAG: hypothetical protein WBG54_02010 [Acidobacteriaceae bacterium]
MHRSTGLLPFLLAAGSMALAQSATPSVLVARQSDASAPASSQIAAAIPAAASSPRIVYTFSEPQLQPSRYTITIDENGFGHFVSEAGPVPAGDTDDVYPAPMDREIHLDDALRAGLFRYARDHQFFQQRCSRGGHLAFTGNKTIAYIGPDGRGSCAFIWASDPELQRLSDQLSAVAFTLEIGRRLDVEVHHDPLGLDSELESLEEAVKDQRASDLPNIAPQLEAIVSDEDVMDRARQRAQNLLDRCENSQQKSN